MYFIFIVCVVAGGVPAEGGEELPLVLPALVRGRHRQAGRDEAPAQPWQVPLHPPGRGLKGMPMYRKFVLESPYKCLPFGHNC